MTESEYVLCGDLRSIRHVIPALKEVIPANNPHIPEDEYREVIRLLSKWQDALFRVVSIDPVKQENGE